MQRKVRCDQCGSDDVRVLAVMREGKVDPDREVRHCQKCGLLDKREKVRRPRVEA